MRYPTASEIGPIPKRFILVSILLLGLSCNVWWLSQESEPYGFDAPMHLLNCLAQYNRIASARSPLLALFEKTDVNYPPFAHYVACLMMRFFGRHIQVAALSSSLWLIVLCLSSYGIGKELSGSASGILAALFVSFVPSTVGLFRQMYLDVPMTAIAAACVWLLLKTRGFTRWVPSVLLGALIALGMLTKLQFPIVFFLPLASVVIAHRRVTKQFLVTLAIAAAGCSFWYLQGLGATLEFSLRNIRAPAETEGDPGVFTLDGLIYYPSHLLGDHLFLPLALVAALGMWIAVRRFGSRLSSLMCWIVGPLVVFTLLRNKDTRYILPIIPAICIFAAIGLCSIRRNSYKTPLLVAVSLVCLTNLTLLTFPVASSPLRLTVPILGEPFVVVSNTTYSSRAAISATPLTNLLRRIVEHATEKAWKGPRVAVVAHTFELNEIALSALAAFQFPDLQLLSFTYPYTSARSPADIFDTDYVITKDGYLAREAEAPAAAANMKRFVVSECGPGHPLFRLVGSESLWEGDTARLYAFSPNLEKLMSEEVFLAANEIPLEGAILNGAYVSGTTVRPSEPVFVLTQWVIGNHLIDKVRLHFALRGPQQHEAASFSRWVEAERQSPERLSVRVLSVTYPPANALPGQYDLLLGLPNLEHEAESATMGTEWVKITRIIVLPDDYLPEAPTIESPEQSVSDLPHMIQWSRVPTSYAYELAVFRGDKQIGALEIPREHVQTSEFARESPSVPLEVRIRAIGLLGQKGEFSRPLHFIPEFTTIY